jgi:dTDP-4-dehydrorhamnose 3,5-epimerase
MKFTPTSLSGAFIVEIEPHSDERGFFARTFCAQEFEQQGLVSNFVQCSASLSIARGTLRGLHYQQVPACEAKLVRCAAGALFDVIVDLRRESRTYLKHFSIELTAESRTAVYVPAMFAHGFQALEANTEVFYMIDTYYTPELSTGIRFNDPKLGIPWPLPVAAISEKDANWPLIV